eukprot:4691254-Prymnesium_polylepis.1
MRNLLPRAAEQFARREVCFLLPSPTRAVERRSSIARCSLRPAAAAYLLVDGVREHRDRLLDARQVGVHRLEDVLRLVLEHELFAGCTFCHGRGQAPRARLDVFQLAVYMFAATFAWHRGRIESPHPGA